GVAPLLTASLAEPDNIIINAASGVTGAGKSPAPHLHFPEQNESFMAYGTIGGHRHQPEMLQTLSIIAGEKVSALFVPHLLPIDRGILETIYLDPTSDDIDESDLMEAFIDAYDDEPFVRVRETLPNVKHVAGTNFCDVTVRLASVGDEPKIVV